MIYPLTVHGTKRPLFGMRHKENRSAPLQAQDRFARSKHERVQNLNALIELQMRQLRESHSRQAAISRIRNLLNTQGGNAINQALIINRVFEKERQERQRTWMAREFIEKELSDMGQSLFTALMPAWLESIPTLAQLNELISAVEQTCTVPEPLIDPINKRMETLLTAESLSQVVENGDINQIEMLHAQGIQPTEAQKKEWSRQLIEILSSDKKAIAGKNKALALIKAGADPNTTSEDEWCETVLCRSIARNMPEVFEALLVAGADPLRCGAKEKSNALHYTASWDRPTMMARLLELPAVKAEVNAREITGKTSLFLASDISIKNPMVEMLLEAGGDPAIPDNNDLYPFEQVRFTDGESSNRQILKLLPKDVSQAQAQDTLQRALAKAVGNNCPKLVESLRQKGVIPTEAQRKDWGRQLTEILSSDVTARAGKDKALLLIKAGADPNAVQADEYQAPALCLSISVNLPEIFEALLANRAEPLQTNAPDKSNALHYTAGRKRPAMMARLLALPGVRANINSRDSDGETALFYAAEKANQETVDMLLAAGADPGIPDNKGRLPYQAVRRNRALRRKLKKAVDPMSFREKLAFFKTMHSWPKRHITRPEPQLPELAEVNAWLALPSAKQADSSRALPPPKEA